MILSDREENFSSPPGAGNIAIVVSKELETKAKKWGTRDLEDKSLNAISTTLDCVSFLLVSAFQAIHSRNLPSASIQFPFCTDHEVQKMKLVEGTRYSFGVIISLLMHNNTNF